MQTFLPYPSFVDSAEVLDLRRLGKQIIEAGQILRAIHDPEYGWQNHPATRMWREHPWALWVYTCACNIEWRHRRGKDHGALLNLQAHPAVRNLRLTTNLEYPSWFGDDEFHRSHRSNLVRKAPEIYRPIFEPGLPDDLPYVWPA